MTRELLNESAGARLAEAQGEVEATVRALQDEQAAREDADRRSKLKIRDFKGKGQGRTVMKRRASGGVLWSTALTPDRVYVTILDPDDTNPSAEVVSESLRQ